MTRLCEDTAKELLGPAHAVRIEEPTMTTEDFGYYLQEVPGSFYHIGAGCSFPLHNPEFLPADSAVLTAAALHAAVIENFLSGREE